MVHLLSLVYTHAFFFLFLIEEMIVDFINWKSCYKMEKRKMTLNNNLQNS